MMSDDVIVTAIMLAICVIVMAIIGAICRILGNYVPKGHHWQLDARWPDAEYGWPTATKLLASDDKTASVASPSAAAASSSSSAAAAAAASEAITGRVDAAGLMYRGEEEEEEERRKVKVEVNANARLDERVKERNDGGRNKSMDFHKPSLEPCPSNAKQPAAAADTSCLANGNAEPAFSIGCDDVMVEGTSDTILQRALSCDSVMSDTSTADTDQMTNYSAAKIGQLEFGLHYDSELSDLVVNVIQAKDLEKNPITGSQNSFVKLRLTPHDDCKFQTKIQKDSVSPQYSERFRFHLGAEELDESIIQFQVYSCDRYARQKLLGETELRLGDIDVRQPLRIWMNLHEMDQRPADFGDVMFSLAYLPTAERLTVVIAKARNLQCPVGKLSAGCFAKVHLLQRGKKVAKKKTSKKHDDRNPIFNEAMTFFVPASALLSVQLRISMLITLPDKSGEIYPVGHVTVGPKSNGTELVHWTQTMTSLRKPVTMWHSLRRD